MKANQMAQTGRFVQLIMCVLAVTSGTATTGAPPSVSAAQVSQLVASTPCTAATRVCVDLAKNRLWLLKEGRIALSPMTPLPNPAGLATRAGVFFVQWKAKYHRHPGSQAVMPWAVFFGPGDVAFQQAVSGPQVPGVVRLRQQDAQALYSELKLGDRVEVR